MDVYTMKNIEQIFLTEFNLLCILILWGINLKGDDFMVNNQNKLSEFISESENYLVNCNEGEFILSNGDLSYYIISNCLQVTYIADDLEYAVFKDNIGIIVTVHTI